MLKAEYTNKPEEMDITSSSTVAYIRKNIGFVEATEERDAHWECDEYTIPMEYYRAFENQSAINDYLMMMVEE